MSCVNRLLTLDSTPALYLLSIRMFHPFLTTKLPHKSQRPALQMAVFVNS